MEKLSLEERQMCLSEAAVILKSVVMGQFIKEAAFQQRRGQEVALCGLRNGCLRQERRPAQTC